MSLVEAKLHAAFRLTEESFQSLRNMNVPEEVLTAVFLEYEQFDGDDEQHFVNTLKQRIGAAYTLGYKTRILSVTRHTLRINPIFDYRQVWCWSADEIKGESSSGSAWGVHFTYGYVDWNLFLDSIVRAVRSRQ